MLLLATGKPAEAEAEVREAISSCRSWPTTIPPSLSSESGGPTSTTRSGWLSQMGKPAEAEAEFRASVAILRKVVADDPAVLEPRDLLAQGLISSAVYSASSAGRARPSPKTNRPSLSSNS